MLTLVNLVMLEIFKFYKYIIQAFQAIINLLYRRYVLYK